MSGVIFLPPRPESRHIYLVVVLMRSALRRVPRPWRRAAAPDPALELGGAGFGRPKSHRQSPGELEFRCRRRDGRHVIALSGALNLTTRHALVEAIEEAIEDDEGQIVLDLSDLESIDHAGVSTILTEHLRASDELKLLVICPGPPPVQRVLDGVEGPFLYMSSQENRGVRRRRSRLGRTASSHSGREGAHSAFRSG